MHQEEVHIVQLQIIERILEALFNVIRMVLVVPELGCHEELMARHP